MQVKSILLLDFVRGYDVGKVLHKYYTSTFPISTLTITIIKLYMMYYVVIHVLILLSLH